MANILLVEDDIALNRSITKILTKENYHIYQSSSYQQALHDFEQEHIDLMIIDIQLPDGNGIELCQTIRKTSSIPILFLTALDSEDILVKGLNSGGDDYMTKPFRIKELYARIASLLRRTQTDHDVIMLGDLSIDVVRRSVHKEHHNIELSAMDFELLKTFALNQKQVLTRIQLLEILDKDGQYYVEDNTLSVHIKRLREKIGTYHGMSYIETVRGIGYRVSFEVLYGNQ